MPDTKANELGPQAGSIVLVLTGRGPNESVELRDLAHWLSAVRAGLRDVERRLADNKKPRQAAYDIVDVEMSSPLRVEFRPRAGDEQHDHGPLIALRLAALLRRAELTGRFPAGYPNLNKLFGGRRWNSVERVELEVPGETEPSVLSFREGEVLTESAGIRQVIGSATGMAQRLNFRPTSRRFTIWPALGPSIVCEYDAEHEMTVMESANRPVTVRGLLSYRGESPFPHRCRVRSLEPHPVGVAFDPLGGKGLAPDATGAMCSEDFIRNVRDGWDRKSEA